MPKFKTGDKVVFVKSDVYIDIEPGTILEIFSILDRGKYATIYNINYEHRLIQLLEKEIKPTKSGLDIILEDL